jgi:hypothetical protein
MAAGTEAVRGRAFPRLAWVPIIAGVFLAVAAHVVMGLIGAALGLAAEPADSSSLGALAGFWTLLTPLVATWLGAWLACRLAAIEEVQATNLHGLMVWCIGLIAGALFLTGTTASGAMSAGTAAGGNAGVLQRMTGAPRTAATAGSAEAAQDAAARTGAKVAGGAAMAALAGLLGAFAGAATARSRREGRGLGWRIAFQRTGHAGEHRHDGQREYPDRAYTTPGQEARDMERSEGPGSPGGGYPH